MMRSYQPSLLLLDSRHLQPELFQLCRQLRELRDAQPIPLLMFVYDAIEVTRLVHMDLAIDDFIQVPPLREELFACIHTLMRSRKQQRRHKTVPRGHSRKKLWLAEGQIIEIADLRIDVNRGSVTRQCQPIALSQPLLFDLLLYLVLHRGTVLSRSQLLQSVWGYEQSHDTRTVDVHMRWLREKLEEDPSHPQLIQTIRGVGYLFKG
jgi:DNA-binding response OmpR family regulator